MDTMSAIIASAEESGARTRQESVEQLLVARMRSNRDKYMTELNALKKKATEIFSLINEYENKVDEESMLASIMMNPNEIIAKMKAEFNAKVSSMRAVGVDNVVQTQAQPQRPTYSTVTREVSRERISDSETPEETFVHVPPPPRTQARPYITFEGNVGTISAQVQKNFIDKINSRMPATIEGSRLYTKVGFMSEEDYNVAKREKIWDVSPQEILRVTTNVIYEEIGNMTTTIMDKVADKVRGGNEVYVVTGFTEKPYTNILVYSSGDTYFAIYMDNFFKNRNWYLRLINIKQELVRKAKDKNLNLDFFHSFEEREYMYKSPTYICQDYSHVTGWIFN